PRNPLPSADSRNTICQKRPFSDAVPLARLQSMSRFRLTFRQAKWLGEFGELFRLGTGRNPREPHGLHHAFVLGIAESGIVSHGLDGQIRIVRQSFLDAGFRFLGSPERVEPPAT